MDALEILPMEIWKIVYDFLSPNQKYYFGLTCYDFKLLLQEDDKITLHIKKNVNDTQLKFFGNCKSVVIHDEELTGRQLKFLSNVKNLNLKHCVILEPEDILQASLQCTSLSLYGKACQGLDQRLIQLKELSLTDDESYGDEISCLTNLESLSLKGCDNYTGYSLLKLTKLKKLKLIVCCRFTQENLSKLVGLKSVYCSNCSEISGLPKGVKGEIHVMPLLTSTNNSYMRYGIAPHSIEEELLPFIGM